MTKGVLIVRSVALWIIFVLSLGVVFFGSQQFAVSLVKMSNGSGYNQNCPGGYCMPMMTYSSCILPPPYPSQMGGMGIGGMPTTEADAASMKKYDQDYQKYSESYQQACRDDVARQQNTQRGSSLTDILGYAVLVVLGLVAAGASLLSIRKTEEIA